VKRIEGIGSPEDSCVVQGVVCNKNLALRRMRTSIDTPRVLLLAGDLEHQRGREKKLLSFDTAIDQVGPPAAGCCTRCKIPSRGAARQQTTAVHVRQLRGRESWHATSFIGTAISCAQQRCCPLAAQLAAVPSCSAGCCP
jgi:hypothetical protein